MEDVISFERFRPPAPRRPHKDELVLGVGRQRHALDQRESLRPPISSVHRWRPGRHRLTRGARPRSPRRHYFFLYLMERLKGSKEARVH